MTGNDGNAAATQQEPAQPQFYRTPEPLNAGRHADLGITEVADFSFAGSATSVMLTAPETALASRVYPIVFSDSEIPMPVAILGLRKGENLFVKDGKWEERAYIPAYVRRYPFAFVESEDKTRLILCVDTSSPAVTPTASQKFFEDGQESAVTKRALDFCRAFQTQHSLTLSLGRMLRENDLLVRRQADIQLGNKDRLAVTDFLVVDEERLGALDDDRFLGYRKNGTLPFLYFHIMSLANFRDLAGRC